MANFDVSKKWIILAGRSAQNVADELALYIGILRERAGFGGGKPAVEDAETFSPPDSVPIIILNAGGGDLEHSGFAWRLGKDRLEMHGDSLRGLWNAVFDFLSALGFVWPQPGVEKPPAAPNAALYPLKNEKSFTASVNSPKERRRLAVKEKTGKKEREAFIRWAARNKIDALVFSLGEKSFWTKAKRGFSGKQGGGICGIVRYALIIEAGGGDLSLLLPRRLFFFHRDLFRMEGGKRTGKHHFCPTNPKTTSRIMERAGELFGRAAAGMTANLIKVFHLRPEAGFEAAWCACPACRAFSHDEQYLIAVNTAADALAKIDPKAQLLFLKTLPAGHDETASGIAPRKNMFALARTG